MIAQNELRLLIKIATLYYDESMKQSEIAKALNVSQSLVSRALSRSLKEGLVKISVVQPANIFVGLEQKLQEAYNLPQAIVVDVPDSASNDQIKRAIGSMAAHYVQTTLSSGELVGISSWSTTIQAMVSAMHPLKTNAAGVIQLLGGVGQNNNLQATMLTQSLANILNCASYLLPAVSIERSVEEKKLLLKSIEVAAVVDKFEQVNVAIVGIGSTEPSSLLRNSGNFYHEEMAKVLNERGAVGDICLHYYDATGAAVLADSEDPVVSMQLDQFRNCERVVGLAGGASKVSAIKGALVGKFVDVLITDRLTAETLLSK